mmetsp:Transcript_27841/g.70982  ORF Transcript_27841/g.70982 Transcript_27841/m.70982 type:complete len:212 (+) Transcript_27841:1890-2525(+)
MPASAHAVNDTTMLSTTCDEVSGTCSSATITCISCDVAALSCSAAHPASLATNASTARKAASAESSEMMSVGSCWSACPACTCSHCFSTSARTDTRSPASSWAVALLRCLEVDACAWASESVLADSATPGCCAACCLPACSCCCSYVKRATTKSRARACRVASSVFAITHRSCEHTASCAPRHAAHWSAPGWRRATLATRNSSFKTGTAMC